VGLALRTGGWVCIGEDDEPLLGQVVDYDLRLEEGPQISGAAGETPFTTRMRYSVGAGHGVVLGDAAPFHDAPVRPAEPHEVERWMARTARPRARLSIGEALRAPGVPVALAADLETGALLPQGIPFAYGTLYLDPALTPTTRPMRTLTVDTRTELPTQLGKAPRPRT